MKKMVFTIVGLFLFFDIFIGVKYFFELAGNRFSCIISFGVCKKLDNPQSLTTVDPYSESGVFDVGYMWIVAKKVTGGVITRGTWDRDDQGLFTPLLNIDSLKRLKDKDGAPSHYFITKDKVYFFETLSGKEKKTSQEILIPVPIELIGADPKTFEAGISTTFNFIAKDDLHVYLNGVVDYNLDSGSIVTIKNKPGMFRDINHVYQIDYYGLNNYTYHITPYDPLSFSSLGRGEYAQDINGLYFGTTTITEGDPKTATVVVGSTEEDTPGNQDSVFFYLKDKNHVYYKGKIIPDANPETFVVLTSPRIYVGKGYDYPLYNYAKDSVNVYYKGFKVYGADSKTFTPVNNKNNYYEHFYGMDAKYVYEGTTTIPNMKPNSVEPLWSPVYEGCSYSHYVKNSESVFFGHTLVKGADSKTFESLINGFGRDKNGIWQGEYFRYDLKKDFVPDCDFG